MRRLGLAPVAIETVATLFPTMPRNACAVVTALRAAQGRVLSPWTLADAVADATGNAPSTGAVRSAVTLARRHGAVIVTRPGLGYQIRAAPA